jgi:hypothetical protein
LAETDGDDDQFHAGPISGWEKRGDKSSATKYAVVWLRQGPADLQGVIMHILIYGAGATGTGHRLHAGRGRHRVGLVLRPRFVDVPRQRAGVTGIYGFTGS